MKPLPAPYVPGDTEAESMSNALEAVLTAMSSQLYCYPYLGVTFNSLLVGGVRYDIAAVPLSVNT
jgi:hypothetical protein